jgi:hypothetical protein
VQQRWMGEGTTKMWVQGHGPGLMGLFGVRLVESRKRLSPPSVYIEQSTPADVKLCLLHKRDMSD